MKMVNEQRRLQDSGSIGRPELVVERADEIVKNNLPTRKETQEKQDLVARLRAIITRFPDFPGSVVRQYGWSCTAFDMKGSNLDLVVFTEDYLERTRSDWASVLGNIENTRRLVTILSRVLQEHCKDQFVDLILDNIPVPMLTLKDTRTSITVRITVYNNIYAEFKILLL